MTAKSARASARIVTRFRVKSSAEKPSITVVWARSRIAHASGAITMAVPAGRLGLILKRMAETGERATQAHGGANVPTVSRDATPTLADLGIPRDRAENVRSEEHTSEL